MQRHDNDPASAQEFDAKVATNQKNLTANLKRSYDFIVCGSGSSGSVVARRLAEDPAISVLLLEAGGSDAIPQIQEASRWLELRHCEQDWDFHTRPNPHLNGRSMPWAMGKVLGGSSSINAMAWARGHKSDWDHFAQETGDEGWSYRSVLEIYRKIENWRGAPNPEWRGSGGPLTINPPEDRSRLLSPLIESAKSIGIPSFADQNGRMMETEGGVAAPEHLIIDGKRLSVFRGYAYPYMDRPNLTVLTEALVTRVIVEGTRAVGVEVAYGGATRAFEAAHEVILSLGAIHTPKILMQSGIGDTEELRKCGIEVRQHLPGVGRNLQDHLLLNACVWEGAGRADRNVNISEGILFWKSDEALAAPDLQCLITDRVMRGPATEHLDRDVPCWSFLPGLVRPASVGRIHLTGPGPGDGVDIDANSLSDMIDVKAGMRGIELCREIGNSGPFRAFAKRELVPGPRGPDQLEHFVRDAAVSFHHYACTAKMGRDEMSVVDGSLKVYGIDGLRIADGSVMPRVTTGNTMAPCVVIGERAADMIRKSHH
ncbi:oxidoreductase [Bradyrhizobium japonicum]|uniref:Oxidoreductase n=1 Tax=Bradyrhizobium japonicum TaxID=375 RepID=A0A0A3XSI8_BRAJP|nr:GMC family oxidoreductase N-terminal domain-containing protein [Bradyrhizobium japonicum]KGT76259.1 oxidoreductase [Bradyrhizobium japonicum]MCS3897298.1 choline dehydrogenase [Bradyrhizobium japonicum USDA 38]MCS3949813.1 choline dehydrogenase [Bradyrhizobium japonicum]MCW2217503.1 choline dehydrogenase [Bradyrhizobium japonicum]MCW2342117.1 choline dehydrogenase [Bradyrhizobium japonicum]